MTCVFRSAKQASTGLEADLGHHGARKRARVSVDIAPRIELELGEALRDVAHVEVRIANVGLEFVPADRCRNRRVLLRARRICPDGGCALAVAQVVDEDLTAAGNFEKLGGETVGKRLLQKLGDGL